MKLDELTRNLLFVGGKGGVGKTAVSQAIAQRLASEGKRTLWVAFEDPTRPLNHLKEVRKNLWHFNCEASAAFEEYAGLKIGMPKLTQIFLQNKLMRYLAKAAPGIHELVLLGKVWYERENYDHVVVDMPSTGYGLAMFQSTENFARLFKGGPVHTDAEAMLKTFRDPKLVGHIIVALPEEMPLVEALELNDYLLKLFPRNPAAFIVNRKFPKLPSADADQDALEKNYNDPQAHWDNPLAVSALDYARKRNALETYNLRIWDERKLKYGELNAVPPPPDFGNETTIVNALAKQIEKKGYA